METSHLYIENIPAIIWGLSSNKIFLYVHGQGGNKEEVLWSSIFVTLVAKKYHESVTLPSGLRMVYDNH